MARDKKLITFWCEYEGHEVTELAGPGQTPHYCAEHMTQAKAHMSKMRMRALRKRQKATTTSPDAPGSTEGHER
jgi:hypothetical protein